MKNIKELGFDKLVRAIEQHDNIEYINGIIDTIEELFRLTEVHEEIKQGEAAEEVEEEPKEEPKKPAPKKKTSKKKSAPATSNRITLDMPTVKAMRDAGRSWEWIADEFSCSAQTVINHWNKWNK